MEDSTLRDDLEIRRLVATYADSVARGDAKTWGETWAEDGAWELLGSRTEGRAAVVELWQKLMAGFPLIVQIASGGVIDVSGSSACGRWYVTEYGLGGKSGLLTLGHYRDRYTKGPDGWRFAERCFDMIYSGPPDLSAPHKPLPQSQE